jgi:hypothetical protein
MTGFIKKIGIRGWHFYLLGLVLINFCIELITGYRLNQDLIFTLKVILYLTGIILFFTTIRPFKKLAIYYSFYAISGILIGLFFLFGGIFLAILSTLVLIPIVPKQTEYKTETIKIYDRFQGFMASCCSYEVVEPKFLIFEKHLGFVNIDKTINANNDEFIFKNNRIIYKHKLQNYGQTTVKDTTEILNFE